MPTARLRTAPPPSAAPPHRRADPLFPSPAQVAPALPDPASSFAWKIKRAVEFALAAALLVMLAPLMLVIAAVIRLESPGPALFRQPRFGRGSRPFDILKFRTMRADLCDPSGGVQTAHRDVRVTRFGMFLRKSSLDELPQLLNVLSGQMAIIGPRAHPCGMRVDGVLCEDLDPGYMSRHLVPPGITGWAQVNGSRGPVDTPEQLVRRVALDLDYIRNWSLPRDAVVLVRTVGICLSGKGAR